MYGLVLSLVSFASATEPTVFPLDKPPEPVAALLDALAVDDPVAWTTAKTKLAEQERAEPYLRHLAATGNRKVRERALEVLTKLYEPISARNVVRARGWIKDGRIDLVVDAGLLPTELLRASQFGDQIVPYAHAVVAAADRRAGREVVAARVLYKTFDLFSEQRNTRALHGTSETTGENVAQNVFLRAQSCTANAPERHSWLTLTRTDLVGGHATSNQWSNSVILHNNRLAIDSCHNTLVICDGDLDITNNGQLSSTILIVHGSVRATAAVALSDKCLVYATGDITFGKPSQLDATLIAGGKVLTAKMNVGPKPVIEQNVEKSPFGVRFFESADIGVEVALKGKDVTIGKLTPGSPLTKYGVKDGDIVTRVNDKEIKTANDLRRELRYSVALEAGIFHITRGDQKITRVVYFKNGLEK